MHKLNKAVAQAAFFISLLVLASVSLQAASFQVSPVRAVLDANNETAMFEFTNTSNEAVSVQLDAKHWAQEDGLDVFTDTNDIVLVPTIISIPAGDTQIARVALFNLASDERETSYRLFFTEIKSSKPKENGNNISMRLRISIPVFVNPASELSPSLDFSVSKDADNKTLLDMHNTGNQHVQVLSYTNKSYAGESHTGGIGTYLLPGQMTQVELMFPSGMDIAEFSLNTDSAGVLMHTPISHEPAVTEPVDEQQ